MPNNLTLFTNPMSRGRIARWMMEEAGQPYEVMNVPFGPQMKSGEYRSVNPMGKVPALRHGEHVVTECAAICAYMAETFPQAGLAPTADERADYFRWMFFAAGPLEQAVTNRAMGFVVPDDKRGMSGYGSYETVMNTLEKAVSAHDFIAGNRFTAADVYVGSAVAWGLLFGSIEKRPAFEAYAGRVTAREAYRRTHQLCEKEGEAMKAAG
jgi:glutathione S-transferase